MKCYFLYDLWTNLYALFVQSVKTSISENTLCSISRYFCQCLYYLIYGALMTVKMNVVRKSNDIHYEWLQTCSILRVVSWFWLAINHAVKTYIQLWHNQLGAWRDRLVTDDVTIAITPDDAHLTAVMTWFAAHCWILTGASAALLLGNVSNCGARQSFQHPNSRLRTANTNRQGPKSHDETTVSEYF